MSQNSEIRASVTKGTDVLIRAVNPEVDLAEPFYAINWFSTKIEWLYHFYNFLAARSVLKIGGEPFFKASAGETIVDDNGKGKRDLLLIIKYPGGHQFKSLMESTYFKIVSIFRMVAVHKFTFGFTQKVDVETTSTKEDGLHYAIHYFKAGQDGTDTLRKIKELLPSSVVIKYSGRTIANLLSQSKGKEAVQVPHLMDEIVVLQATEETDLKTLFQSEGYTSILQESDHNYISLLNRIF